MIINGKAEVQIMTTDNGKFIIMTGFRATAPSGVSTSASLKPGGGGLSNVQASKLFGAESIDETMIIVREQLEKMVAI